MCFLRSLILAMILFSFCYSEHTELQKEIQDAKTVEAMQLVLQKLFLVIQRQQKEIENLKSGQAGLVPLRSQVEINSEEIEANEQKQKNQVMVKGYVNTDYTQILGSSGQKKDSFDQTHTSLFLQMDSGDLRFFSELEWAHSGTSLSQERSWVEWRHSDALIVRAGQELVPTYWNYNHYPQIALTIHKPLIHATVLPFSYTGLSLRGSRLEQGKGISYDFYIGNGIDTIDLPPASIPSEFLGFGRDKNNQKAFGQRLAFHFDPWNHLDLVIHHYTDTRDFDDAGVGISPQSDYEAWQIEIDAQKDQFNLAAAFARGKIDQITKENISRGWYIQPSWQTSRKMNLYARLESFLSDPFLNTGYEQRRRIFGANWHFTPHFGVKFEYLHTTPQSILLAMDEELQTSLYFAF